MKASLRTIAAWKRRDLSIKMSQPKEQRRILSQKMIENMKTLTKKKKKEKENMTAFNWNSRRFSEKLRALHEVLNKAIRILNENLLFSVAAPRVSFTLPPPPIGVFQTCFLKPRLNVSKLWTQKWKTVEIFSKLHKYLSERNTVKAVLFHAAFSSSSKTSAWTPVCYILPIKTLVTISCIHWSQDVFFS